jgi:hypothetical protein
MPTPESPVRSPFCQNLLAAPLMALAATLAACGATAHKVAFATAAPFEVQGSSAVAPVGAPQVQDPVRSDAGNKEPGRQDPGRQNPGWQDPGDPDRGPQDGEQGEARYDDAPPTYASLDLGVAETGISFGNSERWNGLRCNWRDHGVDEVLGLNLTLWSPRGDGIDSFTGIAIGAAPAARSSTGLRVGFATVAGRDVTGIDVSLLAAVSQGSATAIRVAGLAAVSEADTTGIEVAGLATVSEGRAAGVHFGGLATVAEGGFTGIQGAGLATVAEHDITGITASGIASVSQGDITGLTVGGFAVVAEGSVTGIHAAGLATVSQGSITGIGVSGLATVSEGSVAGLHAAGLGLVAESGVQGIGVAGVALGDPSGSFFDFSPRRATAEGRTASRNRGILVAGLKADAASVEGITVAGLLNRSRDFDGIGVSLHNSVSGMLRGLQVGLVNYAEDLRGVQIGLINHVPSNPWPLRWLPLVNFRF